MNLGSKSRQDLEKSPSAGSPLRIFIRKSLILLFLEIFIGLLLWYIMIFRGKGNYFDFYLIFGIWTIYMIFGFSILIIQYFIRIGKLKIKNSNKESSLGQNKAK